MKPNRNAVNNGENPQNLCTKLQLNCEIRSSFFSSKKWFSLVVNDVGFFFPGKYLCTYELVLCYNCHRKEINNILMRSFVTDKLSSSKSVRSS